MAMKDDWQTGDIVTAAHLNAIADEVNATQSEADGLTGVIDTFTATGLALASATDAQTAREAIGASPEIYINVKDYGAVGDGVTDDTAAIEAAMAAALYDGTLFFPAGVFCYNGTGLDFYVNSPVRIVGVGGYTGISGSEVDHTGSAIKLGDDSYFLNIRNFLYSLLLRDVCVFGGKGVIKHTYTAQNVSQTYTVENCLFRGYTECAIASDAADMPNWKIINCLFYAASVDGTIGVALGPGTDQVLVHSTHFYNNQYHLKIRRGPNYQVDSSDFLRWSGDNSAGPRVDVWVVPHTTNVNAGWGLVIRGTKFGNENVLAGDYRILIADEAPAGEGDTIGTRMPVYDADSTGYAGGFNITQNLISLTSSNETPIVYSTTPNINGMQIHHNVLSGGQPSYALEYRTPPAPNRADANIFGPFTGQSSGTEMVPFPATNDLGSKYWDDPVGLYQASDTIRQWSSGSSSSYSELLSVDISAFAVTAPAATTPTTDALGGDDAVVWTMSDQALMQLRSSLPALTPGRPLWVEFDVANTDDGATSADSLNATVWDNGSAMHWRRFVDVPSVSAGWVTYAFCWTPRTVGAIPYLFFGTTDTAGAGKTVKLGRVRMYYANERQIGGRRPAIAAEATDAAETMALANDLRAKLIELGIIKA